MNTELKINSQNDIGIGIGSKAVENIVTIWFGLANNSEYEDLAKLIIDSNSTFQSCGLLPSELLKQNKEMREMLEKTIKTLEDIESTLFHHNHSIEGWHLNGELEPIMNFVAELDMEVVNEAKQFLTPKN